MTKVTNGCGPSKYPRISKYLIPNLCFGDCCNAHDIGYAKGGDKDEWIAVENTFKHCLIRSAATYKFGPLRPLLYLFALIYSFFTKAVGRATGWNHRRKQAQVLEPVYYTAEPVHLILYKPTEEEE